MRSLGRKALTSVEKFFLRKFKKGPYFHVSDSIRNKQELEAVFTGGHYGYIRIGGNPDHLALEEKIATLERAAKVRIRSDGMGAVSMAIEAIASYFAKKLIAKKNFPEDVKKSLKMKIKMIVILPPYGGTYDMAHYHMESPICNIEYVFLYANAADLLQKKLYDAIDETTAAIFFEITCNPTLSFIDALAVIDTARNHPKSNPYVIIDNTFLFGIARPFEWGADIVVNSGTKLLTGLSAWSLGFIAISEKISNEEPELWGELLRWSWIHGGTLGPFEAFMTSEFCIKDIQERTIRHSDNAMEVYEFLHNHPCVESVIYPGAPDYPDREILLKHISPLNGKYYYGGMISFYVKGNADQTDEFLFYLDEHSHIQNKASLLGDKSSVEPARRLSHACFSESNAKACKISDNLVRLSVGLEPAKKIKKALDEALRAAIQI